MSTSVIDAVAPSEIEVAVTLLQAQLAEHGMATAEEALRDVAHRVLADPNLGFILLARVEGGELDLMGEVIGGGGYAELLSHSITIEAFAVRFNVSIYRL